VNLAWDLERRANESPTRQALIYEDGRAWSWAALDDACSGVAAKLAAAGVKAGDRVALFFVNTPELVFSLFACWKLGAVPVSLSGLYGADELRHALQQAGAKMIVALGAVKPMVEAACGEITARYFAPGTKTSAPRTALWRGSRLPPCRRAPNHRSSSPAAHRVIPRR
jgi:acyl-CoA synthetase (AMP-forming)/AMP-acid ligase II